MGLYTKLSVVAGGVAKGGDLPPTNQQTEVSETFAKQLVNFRGQFDTTMNTDVANFNALLKSSGYGMAIHK